MATHASILAWRIPWTKETGGLQSLGLQRIRKTEQLTHTHTHTHTHTLPQRGFPGGASGKEPAANARDLRDLGSILGSGRSPEGGHGNPLQYSCLDNTMDRGAW